jgi:ArsR family transcriptional regulator
MSGEAHKGRLRRLIESGLCSSKSIQEHLGELKALMKQIDEGRVKKQSYLLKALADPARIRILQLLKNRAMCTCELMAALDLTGPNASHHLKLLERNGLVKSHKSGKWVFYELETITNQPLIRILMN